MSKSSTTNPTLDVRLLGRRIIVIAIAWGIIVGCVVNTQVLGDVVPLPFHQQLARTMRIITPQGWAFFHVDDPQASPASMETPE
jgi:hypothetical protein